jgi:hypothetical protein
MGLAQGSRFVIEKESALFKEEKSEDETARLIQDYVTSDLSKYMKFIREYDKAKFTEALRSEKRNAGLGPCLFKNGS